MVLLNGVHPYLYIKKEFLTLCIGKKRKMNNMEWIKVSDRLPEEGVRVLVDCGFIDRDKKPYYDLAVYRVLHNRSVFTSGPYVLHTVTHWMTLPEKPNG
jgi:hypothetical protein